MTEQKTYWVIKNIKNNKFYNNYNIIDNIDNAYIYLKEDDANSIIHIYPRILKDCKPVQVTRSTKEI